MELSYFFTNYLPATWAIWNATQPTPIYENLPSDQEIVDSLGEILVDSLFGLGRNLLNVGVPSSVIIDNLRVTDNQTAINKVAEFLRLQGYIIESSREVAEANLKDWFSNKYKPEINQAITAGIMEGAVSATTQHPPVSINLNSSLFDKIKSVADMYATGAITSTIRGNSGTRPMAWSDITDLKTQLNSLLVSHGIITSGTSVYRNNFNNTMNRPNSQVNVVMIKNNINGLVIPLIIGIASTVSTYIPVIVDGFNLSIGNDSLGIVFNVYGEINDETIAQNIYGDTQNLIRTEQTNVFGSGIDIHQYITLPYSTIDVTSGSTTATFELTTNLSYSSTYYNSKLHTFYSYPLAQDSGFFSGMTAEQIADSSSYELETIVRNNVIYNESVEYPIYVDPNVYQSLIGDTYDVVSSGSSITDRTGEGRTIVLSPTSVGVLTGADVLSGDLVDALPTTVNVYPVDVVTDTTIGSITIPIAQAVEAIDIANEASGASEGIMINPLVSDTGDYGMFTLYKMSHAQLKSLSSRLWSSDFVDNFHPFKNDPSEALISLMGYPIDIDASSSSSTIVCGNLPCTPATGNIVNKLFQTKSLGSVQIPERFNNYLDYSPYTKVSMYLPFVGIVSLDPDEVVGATLKLDYRVELLTGTCVATITVIKGTMNAILYQYNGNMGITLPLSSSDFGRVYSNLIGGALTLGAGVLTGGIGGLAVTALGATNTALNSKPDVAKSGGMGGNSGMCGNLAPYVIIDYAVPDTTDGYNTFKGKPSNKFVQVGSLSGYVSLDDYYLDVPNITDVEYEELNTILKDGFIV